MNSNLDFLSDFNHWLYEQGLSVYLEYIPDKPLSGKKLTQYLTDKTYKGKIWISGATWKRTKNGAEYPVITVVSQSYGGQKYIYSGYNLLRSGKTAYPNLPYTLPSKNAAQHDTGSNKSEKWFNTVENWFKQSKITKTDHPYLVAKGIRQYAHLLREHSDKLGNRWLIIPLSDHAGTIKAYQVIDGNGKKLYAGSSKGLYFLIEGTLTGRRKTPKKVYIVEGLATGLSAHAGNTSRWVAVCLDAGNLEAATAEIKKRFPKCHLRFCADNDWRANPDKPTIPHNVGLKAATLAAAKYRTAKLYLCPLVDNQKADFNDYAQTIGQITDETLNFCEVPIVTPQSVQAEKRFKDFLNGFQHCVKYLSENDIKHYFADCLKQWWASKEKVAAIAEYCPVLAKEWETAHANERAKVDKRLNQIFKPSLPYAERITFNSNYLPDIEFKIGTVDSPEITLLKSPLGSGKTTQIKRFVEMCKRLGYRIVFIIPRKILARWVSRNLGIGDYQVLPVPRDHDHLAIVINSVPLIAGNQRQIVIIDECEQVLKQITSKLIDNKKEVIEGLDSIFNTATNIILTDAHLSRITENYVSATMQRLEKTPRYIRIDNEFKRFEGREMVIYDNNLPLFDYIFKSVSDGKKLFIVTNSRNEAYRIHKRLSKFIDSSLIKVINSDNSQSDENLEFVESIEKYSLDYQVVIVSPSLTSGVSLDGIKYGKYFDELIGFFYSSDQNGSAADAMQQLGRIRYAQTCHVWYEPKTYSKLETNKGHLVDQVNHLEHFICFHADTDGEISSQYRQAANLISPYTPLYADVKALENAMLMDGLGAFKWFAEQDGWDIIDADTLEDAKPLTERELISLKMLIKETNDEFKADEKTGKLEASPLTDQEAIKYEKTGIKSRDQRYEVEAHQLKQFYCESSVTGELLDIDNDGKTQQTVKLWETLKAKDSEVIAIDKAALETANDKWSHPHLKSKLLQKRLYRAVLAAYRGDPDNNGVNANSESVKAFADWVRQHKKALAAIGININLESKQIMASLGIYAGKLGYKTGSTRAKTAKRERLFKLIKGDLLTCDTEVDEQKCFIEQIFIKRKQYGKNHIDKQLKGLSNQLAVHGFTIDNIEIDHGQLDRGQPEGWTDCELQATQPPAMPHTQLDDISDIYALPEELERALAANFF